MGKQQEVIKAFMASLVESGANGIYGVNALNAAVQACSSFTSAQNVIDTMVRNRNSSSSGDSFLKNYCGINLDNNKYDDGAITGSDAGSDSPKTRDSVIPGSGRDTTFNKSNFSVNGANIQLAKVHSTIVSKNNWWINFDGNADFNQLEPYQKFIWQYLKTWWMQGAMNLIRDSYGGDFNFEGKTIYVGFTEMPSGGACTSYTDEGEVVLVINTIAVC